MLRIETNRKREESTTGYPTIILIADGWTRSVFLDLLNESRLPEISESLVAAGGLLTNVVSNLPSVSLASHTSILTSSYQDEHGLPGHRWLDRQTGEIHDYISPRATSAVNDDIGGRVRTVFEENVPSIAIQSVVRRGADRSRRIPILGSGPLIRLTAATIHKNPEATVVTWLPKGDVLAHSKGPDAKAVRRDMIATSRAIGKMITGLERAHLIDGARILLIPDHGHRKVSLAVSLKNELLSAGVHAPVNPKTYGGGDIALTSGDSAAYLYLRKNNFERRADIANILAKSSSVELICWSDNGALTFQNHRGISSATLQGENIVNYRSCGSDPLGLVADGGSERFDLSEPMIDRGYYPDVIHQFMRSQVPERSGDLLLLAARGLHFGRVPRLAWRFGFHRGSHGGPFEEEILVSAVHRGFGEISDTPVRSATLLRRLGIVKGGVHDAEALTERS